MQNWWGTSYCYNTLGIHQSKIPAQNTFVLVIFVHLFSVKPDKLLVFIPIQLTNCEGVVHSFRAYQGQGFLVLYPNSGGMPTLFERHQKEIIIVENHLQLYNCHVYSYFVSVEYSLLV